ncbi:MAG: helix-turn-helix domain-containing protein [Dehalococcoidia bacterium]
MSVSLLAKCLQEEKPRGKAAAKVLGLSRASAYEAVRTGQIPSLRFGKRILVPRAALNEMISQAANCRSDRTQYG